MMAERFLQNSYWVRKFRTRIHYLDTDKDGVITRNDLVLLADRMAQKGKMSAEGEERIRRNVMDIWKAYGVPDDAVIKPEELLRMMAESLAVGHAMEPLYNSYFDAIDLNNNGVISKEEYGIWFDCVGIGRDRLDVSFEAMDTDGDGVISRSEFVAAANDIHKSPKPSNKPQPPAQGPAALKCREYEVLSVEKHLPASKQKFSPSVMKSDNVCWLATANIASSIEIGPAQSTIEGSKPSALALSSMLCSLTPQFPIGSSQPAMSINVVQLCGSSMHHSWDVRLVVLPMSQHWIVHLWAKLLPLILNTNSSSMFLQWNAPLQPDYVITAYTLHHRVPSLKSQSEMWAPPSTHRMDLMLCRCRISATTPLASSPSLSTCTCPPVTPTGTALQLERGVGRHQCYSQPAQSCTCTPAGTSLTKLHIPFILPPFTFTSSLFLAPSDPPVHFDSNLLSMRRTALLGDPLILSQTLSSVYLLIRSLTLTSPLAPQTPCASFSYNSPLCYWSILPQTFMTPTSTVGLGV
ncbi:hypothetical protein EMCRGX_G003392 [Ephydatia muelleri]